MTVHYVTVMVVLIIVTVILQTAINFRMLSIGLHHCHAHSPLSKACCFSRDCIVSKMVVCLCSLATESCLTNSAFLKADSAFLKAKTCTVVSRRHGQSSMTAARLHKPRPARTRCQREKNSQKATNNKNLKRTAYWSCLCQWCKLYTEV